MTYYRIIERILFYIFLPVGAFLLYSLLVPLVEMSRLVQHDAVLNVVCLMVGIMLGSRWMFYSKLFKQ